MMRNSTWAKALRLVVPLAVVMLASGCVRTGVSAKAQDTHGLFYTILWLALPVFIFVEGMLLICLIWFRKRRGDDTAPTQVYGNSRALIAFFAGPLIVVIVLLGFGESTLAKVDHVEPHPDLHLTVTGFQWEWSAQYVDEGFTITGTTLKAPLQMELPVNKTAQITLKSTDVIHEFYVPDLLFMRNAVPGHPNVFTITPTKLGTFHGQCAQYCGLWHAQMRFVVKVVTPKQYAAWLEQQEKKSKGAASGKGACGATSSKVALVAHNISWDKKCIAVDANKPFTVTIDNKDAGVAHNFAVYDSSKMKHEYFVTPNITGVATKTFKLPALKPGTYYFQCDIHGPAMAGTLIVGKPK